MNQEKIMKAKMVSAIILFIISLIAVLVFIGLYVDETHKTQQTYREKYLISIGEARDEINTWLEKQTDYDLHYNMVLSEMGSARTTVFLINDFTDEQKAINELHYCFVKYPEQMKSKLEDTYTALKDIADNLDKGYDEARNIVETIDKKGM